MRCRTSGTDTLDKPLALLIDDAKAVLNATARIVRRAGFEVVACESALDGLARIERGERFAVVVCDLRMPEMTGQEFRRQAILVWPDLDDALAFVSGAEHAEDTGGAAVFSKPVGDDFGVFLHARKPG